MLPDEQRAALQRDHATTIRQILKDISPETIDQHFAGLPIEIRFDGQPTWAQAHLTSLYDRARERVLAMGNVAPSVNSDPRLWPAEQSASRGLTAVRAWCNDALATTKPTAERPAQPDDDAFLSPAKLAELFNVSLDPLRSRLKRWRGTSANGWIENPDRTSRDAQYLYRVGSVRHIITDLQTVAAQPACDQRK